eukprot:gnl/Spiro4/29694_TR14575_c0_g1_i1.p1 gnl/Spiro4/29694_TR14575_c0_g1~~gnl/Spiro4/29694_TR14575_c0_g1_i1.p1  ORF type:complete len:246 (+),score=58.01 gnl/Spiro4/29694_TR14575_c0_g1_i1:41-778(+)
MKKSAFLVFLVLLVPLCSCIPSCDPQWYADDYQLMISDDGWNTASTKDDILIQKRDVPDSGWQLFKWRIPELSASADTVKYVFREGILAESHNWTSAFEGGRVVSTLTPDPSDPTALPPRILYMHFSTPHLVSPRDLCYLECTHSLENGVWAMTYRSVDECGPSPSGTVRMTWRGANLYVPNNSNDPQAPSSSLVLIDQEIQGGWMPSWLINPTMPGFLRDEYKDLINFFMRYKLRNYGRALSQA